MQFALIQHNCTTHLDKALAVVSTDPAEWDRPRPARFKHGLVEGQ